jgi:uncharacterized repeat protein (TIGR01451 family)
LLTVLFALLLVPSTVFAAQPPGQVISPDGDTPVLVPGTRPLEAEDDEGDEFLLKRDDAFTTRRTAGNQPLTIGEAANANGAAHKAAAQLKKADLPPAAPPTFTGAWSNIGPNPIVQITRGSGSFYAVSGRVSALAIRSDGRKILGGAQGGIWVYDETSGTWSPRTDDQATLSIGSIAVAPSNENIVYAGTGEGNLSGDSYFGLGVLKSTDGGMTWGPIGGDKFVGISISKMVVDPGDPNHVYLTTIRGRGGARRTTPTPSTPYGVYESTDGGNNWKLLIGTKTELNGANDLVIDPANPKNLYASFWGDAIYKSTDGGKKWSKAMTGFPSGADFAATQTRFALGIAHPAGAAHATLYAGFEYQLGGEDQPSRIWKSTDDAASWVQTGAGTGLDSVVDYCGTQCFYDNLIGVDPANPNIVYALGLFNYSNGSGGIYRSMDGGATWKDMGWDLHPDYHAIAINPADPAQVMIGSDGGVWFSTDRGGRLGATDPIPSVDWENLNGTVKPATAGIVHRTGLEITQFTSMANVIQIPNRVWGGTQDNGTLRKTGSANLQWFDIPSGDGGQVLVDPTDPTYVYGTYFGISPYRMDDGGLAFFGNRSIAGGINTSDRAEFYIPWVMNQANPDQLFLGTYRLYRTNNAKAPSAGDVHWDTISGDLTSGCPGTAPNGARGCFISAIGLADGGTGVYTGADDGYVYYSPDAVTSPSPTFTRVDKKPLPERPVTSFAVDRSNSRIAYISYAGFNKATPGRPGHVFKTTDAGEHWLDISSNLPDTPVNSLILDPSYPGTVYAGTDVGPLVTYNGGLSWELLGTGFPAVNVWQLSLDSTNRNLRAGTHGRGAWTQTDPATLPALVISKVDTGAPVGPGTDIEYTITLKNIGNADATGVTITDPIPAHTTFASAGDGGALAGANVVWSGQTVTAGSSIDVHFSVTIDASLSGSVTSILDDGMTATAAGGFSTTGSPHVTPIAPPFAVSVTPAAQTDGARVGESVSYTATVTNVGFTPDAYTLSVAGNTFPTAILDATCTTALTTTATLAAGASADVCIKVDVPSAAANGTTDHATFTATSMGSPSVTGSATIDTIAVAVDNLIVDNDNNNPDVAQYYRDALTAAGAQYDLWDLAAFPGHIIPTHFLNAHKNVFWFTGGSYPGPLLPYETQLAGYLDGGGHLFLDGWDILDQAAGTTAFVHDYLHVNWDGQETQNDKATASVTGVAGNPVTDGIGTVALDLSVYGGAQFSDRLTLLDPAASAFTDDSHATDGMSLDTGTYKVVFLAFPFEEYGSASDRADLATSVLTFFGP